MYSFGNSRSVSARFLAMTLCLWVGVSLAGPLRFFVVGESPTPH